MSKKKEAEIEKQSSSSFQPASRSSDLTQDFDEAPWQDESGRPLGNKGEARSVGSAVKKNVTNPVGKAVRSVGKAVRSTSGSVGEGLRRRKQPTKETASTTSAEETWEMAPTSSEFQSSDKQVKFAASTKVVVEQDVASSEHKTDTKVVEVGPWMEVLLRDTTIQIGISLLITVYPTWKNLELILDNEVPVGVSFTWMFLAWAFGQEYGRIKLTRRHAASLSRVSPDKGRIPIMASVAQDDEISTSIPSEIEVPEGYSLFGRASRRFPKLKFQFRSKGVGAPSKRRRSRVWTTLGRPQSKRQPWEKRGYVPVSKPLMYQLLKNSSFRRKSLGAMVKEDKEEYEVTDSLAAEAQWLGTFEASRLDASSMSEDVVVPLFKLRGMDIFMADAAEESMGTHPFLIENGLRDSPTWIVNVLTQWGNILVYMELPKWIKDWNDIQEHDDDPHDIIAFKRFVNGDDDYRNARLRVMPHIVQGPMPVRVLAPKGKELLVSREYLPVTWRKYHAETKNGRTLLPCLETELDCMSNKSMRGMAGIVKRYLVSLNMDVAAIIMQPDDATEEEPKACITTWSFDKIDVDMCPEMPPRTEHADEMSEEKLDMIRASRYAGLTPEQLKEIQIEVAA